ncbi:hypothetical protein VB264_11810 [Arcicella aquatica]|uniref:Uncharacterized protein n=1 Tax=Arcicella aquatica TaxID=217141 RepID=A0ABU5QNI0_9BACT|nr:hypothetical protein [Arcicella aquatica]MEA5258470.1 hypothetical protein [Arcicella aquatica]
MKKIYCILCCFCYLESTAQDGIYLTAHDFATHKLSVTNVGILKERYSSVKVQNDTSCIYNFKNAFGYHKGDKDWRFVGNKSYEIINSEGIYIYRLDISNDISTQLYYFSKEADGELITLSRRNLKKVYADNANFIALLNSINWRLSLEEEIPPFHVVRVAELYNYTLAKQ